MNILIKLTCLIGLVIAPILGSGHHDAKGSNGCDKTKCEMKDGKCVTSTTGKCDMSQCSKMTSEECAKMCDEKGCSPEEKKACLSNYGPNGKWIGAKKDCCKKK
jgi:K(+)-stimulated pyrophosphate-energized sodium pump